MGTIGIMGIVERLHNLDAIYLKDGSLNCTEGIRIDIASVSKLITDVGGTVDGDVFRLNANPAQAELLRAYEHDVGLAIVLRNQREHLIPYVGRNYLMIELICGIDITGG